MNTLDFTVVFQITTLGLDSEKILRDSQKAPQTENNTRLPSAPALFDRALQT